MVYIILNGVLCVFLIAYSYAVDRKKMIEYGMTVNSILFLFSYTLAVFLNLLLINFFPNYTMMFMLVRVSEILEKFFLLNFCLSIMAYPSFKKTKIGLLLEILITGAFIYIVFKSTLSIVTSKNTGLQFYTQYLTPTSLFRWQTEWNILFHYVFPGVAALYIIVRPANTKNKLEQERLVVHLVALLAVVLSYVAFTAATKIAPFFYSLKGFGYLVGIYLAYNASKIHIVNDFKTLLMKFLQIFWIYVVPAILLGVVMIFISKYKDENLLLFLAIVSPVLVAIFLRTNVLPQIFSRRGNTITVGYEKALEKKFADLEYNLSVENFGNQVSTILASEVKCTGINILISNGNEFASVYSSYPSIKSLPLEYPAFDVMMGVGRQVAFKNQLESHHALAGARAGLTEIFEKDSSEACILLAEGYRVFGIILLNEKELGNDYNKYDYNTFNKLYPYFFMIGYYMNSVANEGVIGTINREIKMSDQVIHSIQENMDFIRNPKIDVGYMMKPARNIGGEFIDFIRLTDTRHIVILGSMSGKGITASMSMVIMKSIIRTFLSDIHDFKELIQRINHFIRFNLPRGTFFAGVFALLDFSDNMMYYINCGVPTLMLYTQSYNNVIEIQGDGRVLGFVPDISKYAKVKKIKLNPGDVIFACTDGLIESQALRGESFGKARLQKSIMDNLSYSSNKITQFTYENLRDFTSKEQEADITCLAMKIFADKGGANGTT